MLKLTNQSQHRQLAKGYLEQYKLDHHIGEKKHPQRVTVWAAFGLALSRCHFFYKTDNAVSVNDEGSSFGNHFKI